MGSGSGGLRAVRQDWVGLTTAATGCSEQRVGVKQHHRQDQDAGAGRAANQAELCQDSQLAATTRGRASYSN